MRAVPPSRYLIFLAIAALGCAADLLTKHWIFARLGMPLAWSGDSHIWLWDQVFGLTTSLNEGALFGIGQGNVSLFVILSVVAALGIVYWLFIAGAARNILLTVSLSCVIAGILGNLYDRLGLPGLAWTTPSPWHRIGDPVYAVRDWLHFKVGTWEWPVFNVADSLIVCGAALLCWYSFRSPESAPTTATAQPADA